MTSVEIPKTLFAKVSDEPKSEGGLNLAYDTFGEASNPAVMLIMGLGAQMILWPEEWCAMIAAAGYFVVRYDNRDVGQSTKFDCDPAPSVCNLICMPNCCAGSPPYTLEDMARDCIQLMDKLQLPRAHIVGQSMGGMIAQLVAAEYPDRVLSLTSVYSSPGNPQPALKIKLEMAKKPEDDTRETYIKHWNEKVKVCFILPEHVDEEYLTTFHGRVYDRNHGHEDGAFRQAAALIRQSDRRERLRGIKCPTLLVHGKKDVVVPFEHMTATHECIKSADTLVIDNMGHGIVKPYYATIADRMVALFASAQTEPTSP